MEIVELGINEPRLATSCLGEILQQLYHSDKHKVLIAIDGYNDWLKPTEYPSFRYDNDKGAKGWIPPHDMAAIRMLMKFDGHRIRNGFKLMATTHYRQFNHIAPPHMMNFFDGYTCQVENLCLNDFRNMLMYYTTTGWMTEHFSETEVEREFMQCQGNWWGFHQHQLKTIPIYQ